MKMIYVTAWDNDKQKRFYFNPMIYNNDLEEAKKYAKRLINDKFLSKHYSDITIEEITYKEVARNIFEEEELQWEAI